MTSSEGRAAERFAELLRRYRATAGLSQEQLAERAGLSAHGISDLERGVRRYPYAATLARLGQALHLDEGQQGALRAASQRERRFESAARARAGQVAASMDRTEAGNSSLEDGMVHGAGLVPWPKRGPGGRLSAPEPPTTSVVTDHSPPPSVATDPANARRRLTAAVCKYLLGLSRPCPVVIVVEDVHWADEASLDFLYHLARSAAGQSLLVLMTYRTDEIHPGFRRWLAQLAHDRLASEMVLGCLLRDEVVEMLRAMFGTSYRVQSDFVDELFAVTEGNPFFIEELLAALIATGDVDLSSDRWNRDVLSQARVPHSVQEAVLRRTERHSDDALRTCASSGGGRWAPL